SVPVWTGIGHESDLVVADLVAHTAWKTPTEVAVGVVQRFEDAALEVDALRSELEHLAQAWLRERSLEFEGHWERIGSASRHALNRQRLELQNLSRLLQIQAPALIERQRHTLREMRSTVARAGAHSLENAAREVRHCRQRLRGASSRHLAEQKIALAHFKRTLDAIGPEKTLQRGFMLLERDGEVLSRVADVKEGEQLQIQASDGQLDVTVDCATPTPTSS
ncbi:MAG: exodeoxyribonuclease VII large subunit, partial [Flavobacteriales bacterium]